MHTTLHLPGDISAQFPQSLPLLWQYGGSRNFKMACSDNSCEVNPSDSVQPALLTLQPPLPSLPQRLGHTRGCRQTNVFQCIAYSQRP